MEFLQKYHTILSDDVQKEFKAYESVNRLSQVYKETPNFTTEHSQAEVAEKLAQSEATLRFLHACLHKVSVGIADLEGNDKPRHPLQR